MDGSTHEAVEHVVPGEALRLRFAPVGVVRGRVVNVSSLGMHVEFDVLQPDTSALGEFLRSTQAVDQPFIEELTRRAKMVAESLEEVVDRGRTSIEDLFRDDYIPIPDTNPPQFMTPFTELTDLILPPIQEPMLRFDERVSFCAAVDRRGYLPTHNRKYSKPQGKDPAWNTANCRNRRMFKDRTGLAAGQNEAPYLLQTYLRDMGGGDYVMMKDLSVPVYVYGRHWSGLRLGYRL